MKPIVKLTMKNVRCFADATLPIDPRVTVVIGENGAGKTTVAEAMASLAYGDDEGLKEFPLRHGATAGEIALWTADKSGPVALWLHGGRHPRRQRLDDDPLLLAYGRYRRVYDSRHWEPGTPRQISIDDLASELYDAAPKRRTSTLMHPDGYLLQNVNRYLAVIHSLRSADPRMETVWTRLNDSLGTLEQGLERVEMVEGATEYVPCLVRRGVRLGLHEVSDGYQAVLVIIFDLVMRYAALFPTLDKPLAGRAIVVIDEIDLHLHVRWQRTVLQQLTELFPKTQFLVTTHSPAVVQGAIDRGYSIVTLREKRAASRGELPTVEPRRLGKKTIQHLQGAGIGSTYAEKELFGVPSRYSVKFQRVEDEVRRLRERYERGEAGATDREELFEKLDKLQQLMAADEQRRGDASFMSEMAKLRIAFLRDLSNDLHDTRGKTAGMAKQENREEP
jgi:hypothetical protein